MPASTLGKRLRSLSRRYRETRMFAAAMQHRTQPVLAQIVPIRRCNLACTYCNEFDHSSQPVPLEEMLARIDKLAVLGVSIITISGGEPLLHPDLDAIIGRIRSHGAIATLISNVYLLSPERIRALNEAGLDYLQISIDNVQPDDVSMKSLRVLERKLQWLAEFAEFSITINSVIGIGVKHPDDALTIARRARALGFQSTVGIVHDSAGQSKALPDNQLKIYEDIRSLETGVFTFAHFDRFQENIVRGLPNDWQCRAGARFLYVCEDGLVHWCSQQRGTPGIPLSRYTREDIERQYSVVKSCAPHCGISCVHQTAMLDQIRENPRRMIEQLVERRRKNDPSFQMPWLLRLISWVFLDNPNAGLFRRFVANVLGLREGA